MHPGALLLSLFAIGVVATPIAEAEPAYATKIVYHTNVVTVTQGAGGHHGYRPSKHRHHKHPHKQHDAYHSIFKAPEHPRPERAHKPAYTQAPKPKPKPASPGAAPKGYSGQVLYHHNAHRANHSASDIEWDDGLAATALKIAQTCVYAHNTDMDGGGYGQNIAAGVSGDQVGKVITNLFYNNEVDAYPGYGGEPDMSSFEVWGHFSQVVWCGSTHVGCATYHCGGGLSGTSGNIPPYFTVCNYKGPGNFQGEYGKNVRAPKGQAPIVA